jgi:transposase InsO family protein
LRRICQADQPNECWQSDFTHWQLADGTGVEIINRLDDHFRYLLAARAYRRIDAATVTVIHTDTSEVLSDHSIDPDRSYWRNPHSHLADGYPI